MYAILSEKGTKIDLKNPGSYKSLLLISGLAGIAYILGLFTMPTMILFAMIAGIFTVLQFIIDVYRGRTSEYLLLINVTIFVIAIIGMLVFGLKNSGIDLSTYSIGHIIAYLGMIIGTGVLYLLQHLPQRERKILLSCSACRMRARFCGIFVFRNPAVVYAPDL